MYKRATMIDSGDDYGGHTLTVRGMLNSLLSTCSKARNSHTYANINIQIRINNIKRIMLGENEKNSMKNEPSGRTVAPLGSLAVRTLCGAFWADVWSPDKRCHRSRAFWAHCGDTGQLSHLGIASTTGRKAVWKLKGDTGQVSHLEAQRQRWAVEPSGSTKASSGR